MNTNPKALNHPATNGAAAAGGTGGHGVPEAPSLLARQVPCNIEAEQSLLGAMLLGDPAALDAAGDLIAPADFYRDAHGVICEAMLHLHGRGTQVDLVTLKDELARRGALDRLGGVSYLMTLGDVVPSAANLPHYAHIVAKHAKLRRIIEVCADTAARAHLAGVEDADALAEEAERRILAAAGTTRADSLRPLRPLLQEALDTLDQRMKRGAALTGLPTGFRELDYHTAGLQPSDLIIVAARPAMGKTALACDVARNVAGVSGRRVAIFSLEMSAAQLTERMLCAEAGVDAHRVRTGQLTGEEYRRIYKGNARLWERSLFIDDRSDLTASATRSRCRRLKAEGGLDLVVVDYIQYMASDKDRESRNVEVGETVKGLKAIAKELDVPVIALSQLSRAVENRQDKRPLLSDLRDSGGLEAEADVVLFPYRPAYYERKGAEEGGGPPAMEEAELIIAKQRKGPTGSFKLAFHPAFARFSDLDTARAAEGS